jgi:hypothetical protein
MEHEKARERAIIKEKKLREKYYLIIFNNCYNIERKRNGWLKKE